MSNSSALEIEEIVTIYQELVTLNYSVMAGAVLFIYDYMITIGQEIDFIWSAPLNGATIVFSLNRYVNLATSVFNILQFVPWDSQESCVIIGRITQVASVLSLLIVTVFTALRIFAVWNFDLRVSAPVFLLGLVAPAINVYHFVQTSPDVLTAPFVGCASNTNSSPIFDEKLVIIARSFSLVSEALALLLTWMKTFDIKRAASEVHMKASITTLLLRDGTVYFVTLFLFNLTEVVLARYTHSVGYITPLIQTATSILISRFMLNLRALSRSRNENETMPSLPRFSNLQIASQIAGNMGAPLGPGQEVGSEPGLVLED